MAWLALDIGGANIKVADGFGYAARYRFALWREPARLTELVRQALSPVAHCSRVAITMTGELADCFSSKAEGVAHIIDCVCQAAQGRGVYVYCIDGRLVPATLAKANPLAAAAANWHILARFAGQYVPQGWGILLDIGSTTTDIIPLYDGNVATESRTDTDRLLAGELVYMGVERTPICGLVDTLPFRGRDCPVMREWFATTVDAYLLLGEMVESDMAEHTADGRPATKQAAQVRLSRMIGAPEPDFHPRDALAMARRIAETQVRHIHAALEQVMDRCGRDVQGVVISGQGEFLAKRVLQRVAWSAEWVSLADRLGALVSTVAPSHALAYLAATGALDT